MKKSGKTNRAEPSDLSWVKNFLYCAQLFAKAGWLVFFKKIEGYHAEVSYKFAQGLDRDVVSFDTLKFKLTRELLEEATWILDEREFWLKKVPFTFDAQSYLLPGVVVDSRKGVPIQNFKTEWIETTKILQIYVTCGGDVPLCLSIILDSFNISVMNLK